MEGDTETLNKPKKKTRRGGRGGNKNGLKNTNLTIIGDNVAGLTGKVDDLKRMISVFNPAVLMLQETKTKKTGKIKLENFIVFEKLRDNNDGV